MTVTELLNGLNEEQTNLVAAQLQIRANMELSELEYDYWDLAQRIKKLYLPRLKLHCGQFSTLFETVEDFHEYHVDWLRMNSMIWGRYFRTMVVKYNPIHNTDRTQEETTYTTSTDEGFSSGNSSNTSNSSNKHTADNTDTDTVTSESSKNSNGSSLHQLSAANQTNFHNKTKDTTESKETANGTDTHNGSTKRNETDTGSGSSSVEHEQEYNNERVTEVTHKIRAYGNIGVTTNQQMLAEERQHLAFNVLDKIIEDFKKEFCIMIY